MAFGSIIDIFYQWEYLGVFDFLLPFLLVFALVYGIMSSVRILGDNKPVYVIIALVIGLMSLRYQGYLSSFLSELFPRLGVGLTVLLTVLILVGLFIARDQTRVWFYILAAIGAIIAIAVIYQSFDVLGYTSSYGNEAISYIILGVLIVAAIIAVGIGDKPLDEHGGDATSVTGFPFTPRSQSMAAKKAKV